MKVLQRLAITVVMVAGALTTISGPAVATNSGESPGVSATQVKLPTVTSGPGLGIIGGQNATQNYPGMSAMQVIFPGLGVAKCGAALVNQWFLLTAAHCVSDQLVAPVPVAMPGGNVAARVGSNDRTTGGVIVTGKRVYLYPEWMWGVNWPNGPVSDLALVELAAPVPAALMPISDGRQISEADLIRLIGWGLTAYPGTTLPAILQQSDTVQLPASMCAETIFGPGDLCVGGGACYGDSGSPALQMDHKRWASIGIASRGASADNGCGGVAAYTDLRYAPFRLWMTETMRTRQAVACTCPPGLASRPKPAINWGLIMMRPGVASANVPVLASSSASNAL